MTWVPYSILILIIIVIWFMPKRMTSKEIYITWGILSALSLFVDLFFGHTGEVKLYDFIDPGMQIRDLVLDIMLPPAFGIIFSNYMPQNLRSFLLYCLIWVIFSTVFEWMMVKIDFLVYKGWKLWYSTIIYILTFAFIRWHLHFIRKESTSP